MKFLENSAHKFLHNEIPSIPVKEMVIFPNMTAPFFAGRNASIKAVNRAMESNKQVFLVTQKIANENPSLNDLYTVGVIANILQTLKLPDGSVRVLVEGKQKAVINKFGKKKDAYIASVKTINNTNTDLQKIPVLVKTVKQSFIRYSNLSRTIPKELLNTIEKLDTPEKLIGLVCSSLKISLEKKIELLGLNDNNIILEKLAVMIESECEIVTLQKDITGRVRQKMEKTQKEYFLNEQIKEIQKELGDPSTDPSGALELETILKTKNIPEDIYNKALKDVKRLARLQPMSPESGILRTYLEWITDLPWLDDKTTEYTELEYAEKILNEDHYDMNKPKERILDFLAVHQLRAGLKGPILCFVGPPGTGKTSLGKSVAHALGRNFVRISLGGVRDEAEIRGHRKTYVGALPGKIMQSMKKAGSMNPVFLLDEIDKMQNDFRGDPSAALLEVLDPEQNSTFSDHYLEIPYDLSSVFFITTANSVHNIPRPLLDRMEIIEVPGYTEHDKIEIAKQFIIPKQQKENGLEKADIFFEEDALKQIINGYTMESGVRSLERTIAQTFRKIAREILTDAKKQPDFTIEKIEYPEQIKVNPGKVIEWLGNPRFSDKDFCNQDEKCGVAIGMAWTEVGGTVLPVEVSILEGSGELILTGSLGDVMKESARLALSFLRANAETFSISPIFNKEKDIHIHVPEGAIPKDGPSAGITLTAALLSAVKKIPLETGWAMTGEITLTGSLLPIGGVKEKVLAAKRNKRTKVLLPERNRNDIKELNQELVSDLEFVFHSLVTEALYALFPLNTFNK